MKNLLCAALLILLPLCATAQTVSAFSTTSLAKTSDTTLADVPGMSVRLNSGTRYNCFGQLFATVGNATGGLKFALSAPAGSNLSVNTMRMTIQVAGSGGLSTTALGSPIGQGSTNMNGFPFTAFIDVNAGGIMSFQAAQNASDPATLTILQNCSMTCIPF